MKPNLHSVFLEVFANGLPARQPFSRAFAALVIRISAAPAIALVAALLSNATPASAQIVYNEDFEGWTVPTAINGQGNWTSSSVRHETLPDPGWFVTNWPFFGGAGGDATGNFLLRADPFSQQGDDQATLHLSSIGSLQSLTVSFNYLLQSNEAGQVAVSGNNLNWLDATSAFGLSAQASNDVTFYASADLSGSMATAGITHDVYIRFIAWNPTSNSLWHWFAIDNLQVTATAVPESSASSLICGLIAIAAVGAGLAKRRTGKQPGPT